MFGHFLEAVAKQAGQSLQVAERQFERQTQVAVTDATQRLIDEAARRANAEVSKGIQQASAGLFSSLAAGGTDSGSSTASAGLFAPPTDI